jgi:hypothetical protein
MAENWLLGTWRLMRADPSLDFAPGVRMEFRAGGELLYHIDVEGSTMVIGLVYRQEGDLLHTDNPTSPHAVTVKIVRGHGDVMVLDFAGAQALLIREAELSPPPLS